MKTVLLASVMLVALGIGSGCSSSKSDLTEEDRTKMDKLFREGVKPGGTPTAGERGSEGTPINQADQ